MKLLFLKIIILILIPTSVAYPQYSSSSFYMVAHQDDWQLFMGKDAYNDMAGTAKKVVFIYLTTGDACNRTGDCAYNIPYFKSRENGAKNSVYLVVDNASSPPAGSNRPVSTNVSVNKHIITKWQYKNVVKYFLRLPDGRVDFDHLPHIRCGFENDDSTYINNFRRGVLHKLSDVTGLTIYDGWSDLVNTIRIIMNNEKTGSKAWIHTHEFSPLLNVSTHPDHRETGLIIDNICNRNAGFDVAYHIDYMTYNLPVNLTNDEIMMETGLFAAYNGGKINDGCPTDWTENDLQFCLRNYVSRFYYSRENSYTEYQEAGFTIEAFPNPAFRNTTVSIIVPHDDIVTSAVYDIRGGMIRYIIDSQLLTRGKYDYLIPQLPPGVYILKMATHSGFSQKLKLFFF